MDDKTKSIVAHLWIIGWIIALVSNQNDKGPNTSFYLRQTLGIYLVGILYWLPIPFLYWVIGLAVLVLWILSLLGAIAGTTKPVPVVGEMFQQWFKGIS